MTWILTVATDEALAPVVDLYKRLFALTEGVGHLVLLPTLDHFWHPTRPGLWFNQEFTQIE